MNPAIICKHNENLDDCLPCSFSELHDVLESLQLAVTALRGSAVRNSYITGGTPSWEPLNLSAMSLLQDIVSQGRSLLLGRRQDDSSTANDVLWLLEHQAERFGAGHEITAATRRKVESWRHRADAILERSKAPFALLGDHAFIDRTGRKRHTSIHVSCPVVDPKVERPCIGKLYVHPAEALRAEWGEGAAITCNRDRTHTWSKAAGGWVRLAVLLDDTKALVS